MSDESTKQAPAAETKGDDGHSVAPRGESGDVTGHQAHEALREGHEAPERRGHQPPEGGHIELGHPPAEGVVIVQQAGEMHSPATDAQPPMAAPPKPADAAQSVTPPQAHQESASPAPPPAESGSSEGDS